MLVATLRKVAEGQGLAPRSPCAGGEVLGESRTVEEKLLMQLTDRQRQIMRLVSEGLSNKEIGRRLNIADGTIKVHLHHIFQKLVSAIEQFSRHWQFRKTGSIWPHVNSPPPAHYSGIRQFKMTRTERNNVLPEGTR